METGRRRSYGLALLAVIWLATVAMRYDAYAVDASKAAPAVAGVQGVVSRDAAVSANQPGGGYVVQAQTQSASDHVESGLNGGTHVDSCPGCHWALVPACGMNTPENPDTVLCAGALASCPPGQLRVHVLLMVAGATTWSGQPSACYDPTVAATGAALPIDIVGAVRNYLQAMPLPTPRPRFQPANGTLVNLPTIFDAGTPAMAPAGFDLAACTSR